MQCLSKQPRCDVPSDTPIKCYFYRAVHLQLFSSSSISAFRSPLDQKGIECKNRFSQYKYLNGLKQETPNGGFAVINTLAEYGLVIVVLVFSPQLDAAASTPGVIP